MNYTAITERINIFKMIFVITALMLILSLGSRIFFSCRFAIKGNELMQLYKRKADLEKEIARLEFRNANLASLSYVEEKARSQGFVEMDSLLHVVKPASVAAVTLR